MQKCELLRFGLKNLELWMVLFESLMIFKTFSTVDFIPSIKNLSAFIEDFSLFLESK